MDATRRWFLRGATQARTPNELRPPWAAPEAAFVERCTRCDACVDTCPTGILRRGVAGFPMVDFSRGECTFCRACAHECPSGAFAPGEPPWQAVVHIGAACLALRGIVCRTCGDACQERVIRFPPRAGGVALPVIAAESCNGCGACVAPCPAAAVSVQSADMICA